MVDTLLEFQVNILICIGGDGTQRGAYLVHQAITRRGLDIGVVGIPKTIDNDIAFIERTFGFDTAVSEVCVPATDPTVCHCKVWALIDSQSVTQRLFQQLKRYLLCFTAFPRYKMATACSICMCSEPGTAPRAEPNLYALPLPTVKGRVRQKFEWKYPPPSPLPSTSPHFTLLAPSLGLATAAFSGCLLDIILCLFFCFRRP